MTKEEALTAAVELLKLIRDVDQIVEEYTPKQLLATIYQYKAAAREVLKSMGE